MKQINRRTNLMVHLCVRSARNQASSRRKEINTLSRYRHRWNVLAVAPPSKFSSASRAFPVLFLHLTPMVIAITSRLILRRWQAADREPFAILNADPRVMEFMPGTLSREESDGVAERIEAHFKNHGFGLSAAELRQDSRNQDSRFIGFIGLSVPTFQSAFTPCVEIGWRLAAEYWGQGLATEGAAAMVRYACETVQVEQLVSFTAPANTRSRRVMEKLGMTCDPAENFDHPNLPAGHRLRSHVLYRLSCARR
jgi:RimJ/RimL family protein N-acetyltransferase